LIAHFTTGILMPQLFGFARLGRDAELRYTAKDEPVLGLALAFNYGRKGDDGNRPTQWVEASLWGARAEALVDYLIKGTALCVTVDEVHIETYEKNGGAGQGVKLVGRVSSLEFAGGGQQQERQAAPQQQQQRSAPRPSTPRQGQQGGNRPAPAPSTAPNFADMDDDIPF
jgi:single-strand DNA-binding protein